jgi:RNA polymerase sigma-70 factor (ECF subfamily)
MMESHARDEFLMATLPCLDLVYNLARRLVRDPHLVEDVVQETYTRAFDAWISGRKPKSVEPWLATICLNVGRSLWRRDYRRRETPVAQVTEPADESDVEEAAIIAERRRLVHESLWGLPEEQRIAITLMDLCGLTASEVSHVTGAPRGTVLARVHRGRKRLAALLEKKAIRP